MFPYGGCCLTPYKVPTLLSEEYEKVFLDRWHNGAKKDSWDP